jgi:heme-degrading monooxygenase HmoA
MIVSNLKTPYYAVIFTTLLTDDIAGYLETAVRMEKLAELQEGFLGIESARNKVGITVSYWNSLEAITQWKHNLEHTEVRKRGREQWYQQYQLRICKVERDYGFKK